MRVCYAFVVRFAVVLSVVSTRLPAVRTQTQDLARCAGLEALYPTIYEQLSVFMGGIQQAQLDEVKRFMAQPSRGNNAVRSGPRYNNSEAAVLPATHPDFPWSHHSMVKIVSLNGEFYLPGGHIPVHSDGFAFNRDRNPSMCARVHQMGFLEGFWFFQFNPPLYAGITTDTFCNI